MITGLNKLCLYVLALKMASDADMASNLHSINQSILIMHVHSMIKFKKHLGVRKHPQ